MIINVVLYTGSPQGTSSGISGNGKCLITKRVNVRGQSSSGSDLSCHNDVVGT